MPITSSTMPNLMPHYGIDPATPLYTLTRITVKMHVITTAGRSKYDPVLTNGPVAGM